jgi:hypothetical protein
MPGALMRRTSDWGLRGSQVPNSPRGIAARAFRLRPAAACSASRRPPTPLARCSGRRRRAARSPRPRTRVTRDRCKARPQRDGRAGLGTQRGSQTALRRAQLFHATSAGARPSRAAPGAPQSAADQVIISAGSRPVSPARTRRRASGRPSQARGSSSRTTPTRSSCLE